MKDTHTPVVSIRVPADLLARIDQDVTARGKANRTAWFVDLAAALLDGRLVAAGSTVVTSSAAPTSTAHDAAAVGYSKLRQTGRKAKA